MRKIFFYLMIFGLSFSMISCEEDVEPYLYIDYYSHVEPAQILIDSWDIPFRELLIIYTTATKEELQYTAGSEWVKLSVYGDPEPIDDGYKYRIAISVNTKNPDVEHSRETFVQIKYKNFIKEISIIQE